jgi:hypothetical protein
VEAFKASQHGFEGALERAIAARRGAEERGEASLRGGAKCTAAADAGFAPVAGADAGTGADADAHAGAGADAAADGAAEAEHSGLNTTSTGAHYSTVSGGEVVEALPPHTHHTLHSAALFVADVVVSGCPLACLSHGKYSKNTNSYANYSVECIGA